MTNEELERIAKRMRRKGISFSEISRVTGESPDRVRYWGTYNDFTLKPNREWIKIIQENNDGILTEEELFSSMCY